MGSWKTAFHVAMIGLRKLPRRPQSWLLLGMLAVLTADTAEQVKDFCGHSGYRVTPWLYTFFLRDGIYYGPMLLLGLVFLLCDAPFLDAGLTFTISRCGRKSWCRGQLLYIVIATGMYLLAGFLILCLVLEPYLTVQTGWGKVIITLAHAKGNIFTGGLTFPIQVVNLFPGMTATMLTFLLHWLAGSLLGSVIFFVNLRWRKKAGMIVGAALVLLRSFVQFLGNSWIGRGVAWFSPFSWIQPDRWHGGGSALGAATALTTLLLLVSFACQRTILSRDLRTMNEI